MDLLLRGMIFVLLDIELTLENSVLDLLPDWLGFIFVLRGFRELEEDWPGFRKGQMLLQLLVVYSAVIYVMKLFELSIRMEILVWAMEMIEILAGLMTARWIGLGVCAMAESLGCDLQGRKLKDMWIYLAALQIIGGLVGWAPLVGTVCMVAEVLIGVFYLSALADSRKRWKKEEEKSYGTD